MGEDRLPPSAIARIKRANPKRASSFANIPLLRETPRMWMIMMRQYDYWHGALALRVVARAIFRNVEIFHLLHYVVLGREFGFRSRSRISAICAAHRAQKRCMMRKAALDEVAPRDLHPNERGPALIQISRAHGGGFPPRHLREAAAVIV